MTGRVPAETSTTTEPCVLLKVGEIVLKGGNRQYFERLLQANLRRALRDLVPVRLWNRNGVILIRLADGHGPLDGPAAEAAMDAIAGRVRDVMGIARVCRGVRVARDADLAIATAVAMADGRAGSPRPSWPSASAARCSRPTATRST